MAKILVVDDENNIRLMMRIALQAAGHEVETASDGPDSLEKFGDGNQYDLILLDHRMPGMEGLQVLEEMRRVNPAAQVVMVTAFGTIDLAAQALKLGAKNFLRKPFSADVLRGVVHAAIEGSHETETSEKVQSSGIASTMASINGFRICSPSEKKSGEGGDIRYSFSVKGADGQNDACEVILPCYFTELVKAHADRETIPDEEHFWLWLSEEALANYLWQNAEVPSDGQLLVDDLSTNLKRWVDAILPH